VQIHVKSFERLFQLLVVLAVLINIGVLIWISSGLWRQSVTPSSAMVVAAVQQAQTPASASRRAALDYDIEPLLVAPAEGPAWVWMTVRDPGGALVASGLVQIDGSNGAEPMVLGNVQGCEVLSETWLAENLNDDERRAARALVARECGP
jgi:hypothetical protein